MDILDQILAAEMANEYTDSKQLARTEKKVYTFDGNAEGKPSVSGMVKISDDTHDLDNVVSVEVATPEGTFNFTKDVFVVKTIDDVQAIILDGAAFVSCNPNEGLYFAYYEDATGIIYTSKIVFETVHQIDQKLIPGAVLPVVELSTVASTVRADLTESEAQVMDALNGSPCIIKLNANVSGTIISLTLYPMVVKMGESNVSYASATLLGTVEVVIIDGTWTVSIN